MALIRWDPIREMEGIREGIRRVFEDSLGRMRKEKAEGSGADWSPAVDIFHDPDAFILTMDLPGVNKKDIGIHLDADVLTVKGSRKMDKDRKEDDYIRIEAPYGSFERSFYVPATVDPARIEAKLENGVLQIVLPVKEETKPKQIQVSIKS